MFELVLAWVGGGDAVVAGAPATDELVVGDELDGSKTMLDDSVDVSAARGTLDVEASVTRGIEVEDRTTLNVDVTRVDGCVEKDCGGGGGGNGRREEDGRVVVDEGGAGALLGRLVVVADGCACVWVAVAVAVLCCPFLVLVHFFSSSSSSQSSSFSSGSFSFSLSCLALRAFLVSVSPLVLLLSNCIVLVSGDLLIGSNLLVFGLRELEVARTSTLSEDIMIISH